MRYRLKRPRNGAERFVLRRENEAHQVAGIGDVGGGSYSVELEKMRGEIALERQKWEYERAMDKLKAADGEGGLERLGGIVGQMTNLFAAYAQAQGGRGAAPVLTAMAGAAPPAGAVESAAKLDAALATLLMAFNGDHDKLAETLLKVGNVARKDPGMFHGFVQSL